MDRKRILVIVMVAAGAVLGGGCAERLPEPTPTAAAADTIAVATGVGWVSVEGMVVPRREGLASVPMTGLVAEILVSEGDRVSQGDPLLKLDATDQEIRLQQAQWGVAQAEANLESARAILASAQADKEVAALDVEAAGVELALLIAGPTAEAIAVGQAAVDAAEAVITAAAGNQAFVLERAQPAQVLAAESQLVLAELAEKRLHDAVNTARGEARTQLENQLQAAVAGVNAAQAALDELQSGASPWERLSAGAAVAQATAQRDAALAQLELLRAGPGEPEVKVARVTVQQAEAALARAENAVTQAEMGVTRAGAGVEQAHSAVAAAQIDLGKMTLTAPIDGVVTDIACRQGEVVAAGAPVVEVADFTGWQVETTDLNELDVVALAIGFPAELHLDALPGETLTGMVTRISPSATVVSGDVRYVVTIRLDEAVGRPLRWGMTAQVEIEVDR